METITCLSGQEALRALTARLVRLMKLKNERQFNLALSGGETAKQMYELWVEEYGKEIDWGRIRFFWVDERCVAADSPDSNYGHARRLLFKPLNISERNIHRIRGEDDPEEEAKRYAEEVGGLVSVRDGYPHFDCILLGVGDDLHTASIFPYSMSLLTDKRSFAVSQHRESGLKRVTMTGPVILNDTPLLVPIVGPRKAAVIAALNETDFEMYPTPAVYILSEAKDASVYTEKY